MAPSPPSPADELLGLPGEVALVTGGNRGIGRGIAEQLARLGAQVVIACRSEAAAAEAIAAIRAGGGAALWLEYDAARPDMADTLVAGVLERCGRLDVLVANAGMFPATRFDNASADDWDAIFAVNARAAFLLLRAGAEAMRAAGTRGRIVMISSMGSIRPAAPPRFAYNASKAAVNRLTEDAARHYARHGIRVNAVLPGPIASAPPPTGDAADEAATAMLEAVRRKIPLGQFGTPSDVAAAVAFLASPASRFITGHLLVADGGFTLG